MKQLSAASARLLPNLVRGGAGRRRPCELCDTNIATLEIPGPERVVHLCEPCNRQLRAWYQALLRRAQ